MRVTVLFFGILREAIGHAEEQVEIPPGSTLGNLFQRYSERFETVRDRGPSILFARNREFAAPDTVLSENDEVAFLPPVSGGSAHVRGGASGHIFSITREVINSAELARKLQRPEDGAVVIFEGIVRNNTKGRTTRYLEYECYEPMALAGIERIGHEIAEQFSLGQIGVVHRLGRLEVGEASVAIITTAPHRRPAFEAALLTIDRLKREVPIWKKEYFGDGAVWVEGEWDERLLRVPSGVDAR